MKYKDICEVKSNNQVAITTVWSVKSLKKTFEMCITTQLHCNKLLNY